MGIGNGRIIGQCGSLILLLRNPGRSTKSLLMISLELEMASLQRLFDWRGGGEALALQQGSTVGDAALLFRVLLKQVPKTSDGQKLSSCNRVSRPPNQMSLPIADMEGVLDSKVSSKLPLTLRSCPAVAGDAMGAVRGHVGRLVDQGERPADCLSNALSLLCQLMQQKRSRVLAKKRRQ